ncbi:hypothetical protein JKA74_04205 [Marivirga sp. S37H4]|uniref:TonB-dependent receptor-like beta-barrel domain-containing protein n=1 Tax=Marivirga aurantiaca TaxID=2802615 RepID=A0A934WW92_9BACT|nr:hypothetical protein [Marivirga aurantiaca]MBK6264228.1 hypothetical protein [Marivirga aurantiaca]
MRYLLLITFLAFANILQAQDNWEDPKTGEIEDSQIIIEKNRKIELPGATRNFQKVPKIEKDSSLIPVSFEIKEFQPTLNSIKPRIRVLTVQDEKLQKLYANQVKVGLGNYGATYLEGFLANKRSKNQSYGLQLTHESFARGAVDGNNSASGYQLVRPYGKLIFNNIVVEADAFYERHNNYLYGYDSALTEVDRDSIQRTFHTVGAHVRLKDRDMENPYQYGLSIDAYQLNTNYKAGEGSFDYDLTNEMNLSENFKVYLNSNGFFSKYQFNDKSQSRTRNLFRIQPGIVYSVGDLTLNGGLNFVYENDTLESMNQLHVYPDIFAKYQLSPKIFAKAGLKGDVRGVRLRDLLLENPYLNDSIALNHTLMPFQLYGSLYGSLTNVLGFEAGFSVASVKNNYGYYVNPENTERFEAVYFTGNNTEINIYTGVSAQINQEWNARLRGDYFYYNLSDGLEMPYRPNFLLKFDTDYLIAEKLTIGLNGHLQGSMYPGFPPNNANPELVEDVKIPAIYDLGIKLDYKLSNRSSVFLHANNLIAKEYEYYFNYPNRGFQVLGGFIYSF